jgi:catechol 2,3-dioxygenase-like lactoylglutathione lyase family enzyme
MNIGRTHHVAITTPDLDRLRAFYVDRLGLSVVGGFPAHGILFVRAGDNVLELVEEVGTPTGDEHGGWNHLAWQVADVDETYAELLALGAQPQSAPEDFPPEAPSLRIAFARDPDGNRLELVETLEQGRTRSSEIPGPDGILLGPGTPQPGD